LFLAAHATERRRKEVRDFSIALVSTSALLLTILAVGHPTPINRGVSILGLISLYFSLGFGVVVLFPGARGPWDPVKGGTGRIVLGLQMIFFVLGLIGTTGSLLVSLLT
jgi:hypothetical protein